VLIKIYNQQDLQKRARTHMCASRVLSVAIHSRERTRAAAGVFIS